MKAEEFARILDASAPSEEAMMAVGLSQAEAKRFVREFSIDKLSAPVDIIEPLKELGQLLANYDVSNLQIADIELLQLPYKGDTGLVIGSYEADILVMDCETGVLRVEEHATDGHVLCDCALDGSAFLAALAHVVSYQGRCAVDRDLYRDNGLRNSVARECAKLAGGSRFDSFYQMLLGVEEEI